MAEAVVEESARAMLPPLPQAAKSESAVAATQPNEPVASSTPRLPSTTNTNEQPKSSRRTKVGIREPPRPPSGGGRGTRSSSRRKFVGGSPPPKPSHAFGDWGACSDDNQDDDDDPSLASHPVDRLILDNDSADQSREETPKIQTSRRPLPVEDSHLYHLQLGKSRLRAEIPAKWEPYRPSDAEQVRAAADDFDAQHERLSRKAHQLMRALEVDVAQHVQPPSRASSTRSPRLPASSRSSLNSSRPVSRHQRAIYMPPQKQAATLWPPPLDNFDYGPLPDERYTQALLAIRSIRYPVQPLRFGALVSPRSKFERLTRCYLENDGSGDVYDGPPGGPWTHQQRVIALDDAVRDGPPVKRAWKIEESIWAPRRKWADSRDFYDTPECLRKALEADWRMAGGGAGDGFDRFILKHHKVAGGPTEALELVLNTLEKYVNEIYCLFDAYAMQGSGDFTHIQMNSYKDFLLDCDLVEEGSEGLCGSRWDELFVAINATSDAEDVYNHKKGFNRQEWIDFLVRAAVMRHCQQGDMDDVATAVDRLIAVDVVPKIRKSDPLFLEPANTFRRKYCYNEEVSEVLRKHAVNLRCIYDNYAYGIGAVGDAFDDKRLLSMNEYRDFLLDCGLLDAQFNENEASWSFVFARMRVIREASERGRTRQLQLSFEDFLEVLVRIASIKALPYDSDAKASGCVDAGEYLIRLHNTGGTELSDFLSTHDFTRGGPMPQPIDRAVDALVRYLIRIIMVTSGGKPVDSRELKISSTDCKAFAKSGGVRSQAGALAPAAEPGSES